MFGKCIVATIVCRNCHNCPCAISRQYIVGYPDRHGLFSKRMLGIRARKNTTYFSVGDTLKLGFFICFSDISLYFIILLIGCKLTHQLALWSKHHECYSKNCVGTSSKYRNHVTTHLFANWNICSRYRFNILFYSLTYGFGVSQYLGLSERKYAETS